MTDVQRSLELCSDVPDVPVRWLPNCWALLGRLKVGSGDMSGVTDLERALTESRRRNLSQVTSLCLSDLGAAYARSGPAQRSLDFQLQALEISRKVGDREGEVYDTGNVATMLAICGHPMEAVDMCERAADRLGAVGDRRGWSMFQATWAWICNLVGDEERARQLATQAVAEAQGTSMDAVVTCLLVSVETRRDPPSFTSTDDVDGLLQLLGDLNVRSLLEDELPRLARLLIRYDQTALLEEIVQSTSETPGPLDINLLSARATLGQARHEYARAFALHEQAEAAWSRYGYPIERAHSLAGAAACLAALGKPDGRRLDEARSLLRDIGAEGSLRELNQVIAKFDKSG